MKAALAVSLLEQDAELFRQVADKTKTKWGLFLLRNRVAHYEYRTTVAQASVAVDSTLRLFVWLDGLGPAEVR